MSRQQWKVIALFLNALLTSLLLLIFMTPLSGKILAQKTVLECGISAMDWSFQDAQSLLTQYGVDICKQGKLNVNEPQTRAEMASLLAPVMESLTQRMALLVEKLPKKSELDSLNQLLDQITAQVETLER